MDTQTRSAFTYITDVIAENDSALLFPSLFPVTDGHLLVVFKDPEVTWWTATEQQRLDVLTLVDMARLLSDADDFNIGFNDGVAAGQTVMQFHMHVIPRRPGDCEDPTGGVRNVIPEKANYLPRP